jgi:uncharacterized membrane protein
MQRVEKSVRVHAPRDRVYEFWRNFANFPQFMEHVESVQVIDADKRLSHWKLKGPLGMNVEYDAEVAKDEPNRMIGWNSTRGSIETTGSVTFADVGNDTTEVHVVMQWYDPPAGPVGEAVSRLFQNPDQMLEDDLHRFKDVMEMREGTAASHAMSHSQRL